MSDTTLFQTASGIADSVQAAVRPIGTDIIDAVGSAFDTAFDTTAEQGRKLRSKVHKKDMKRRKTAIFIAGLAVSGAVAVVLGRRLKLSSPMAPPAAIPTSDVEPASYIAPPTERAVRRHA